MLFRSSDLWLSDWGKIPETFSIAPENICDLQIIYFGALNINLSMRAFIVVPKTFILVREHLLESRQHLFYCGNIYCSPSNIYSTAANIYYCAEIYITATNIVFSPRKHSNLPREILLSKREIVTTFYFWNAGVPCFGK